MDERSKFNPRGVERMVLLILAAAMPLSIAVANVALGVAVLLLVRRLLVERGTFRRLRGGITLPPAAASPPRSRGESA